jgi:hypothetical protein
LTTVNSNGREDAVTRFVGVISDFVVTDLDDGQRYIGRFVLLSNLRGHAIG